MNDELTKDDLLTMVASLAEENKTLRLQALELRVRLGKATRAEQDRDVAEPDDVVQPSA